MCTDKLSGSTGALKHKKRLSHRDETLDLEPPTKILTFFVSEHLIGGLSGVNFLHLRDEFGQLEYYFEIMYHILFTCMCI